MAAGGPSTPATAFLGTKLGRVGGPSHLIQRARLSAALRDGWDDLRLALVVAPAGYGKSSLLAEWRAGLMADGVATGWVSLDADDNDPVRFFSYLAAALSDAVEGLGDTALAQLGAGVLPSVQPAVTTLLSDIAAAGVDVAVFLDDLHLVSDPEIYRTLDRLLQFSPDNFRLVIASRAEPALRLNELRLQGVVGEFGPAQLSLSRNEIRTFADLHGIADLDDEAVAELQRKTEGWVAGAQLFFLATRGGDDPAHLLRSFTGHDRSISDYLADVVLNRQSPAVRQFLLRTATLDRMCADVCAQIVPDANSQAMLEAIEADSLFVVPLDRERKWFRYHHLFGDFLRNRLELEQPGSLADCRRTASRWFADSGFKTEAVGYALAAGDFAYAAELIAEFASTLVQFHGDHSTLLRWMAALPDDWIDRWPQIRIGYAWSLTFTRQHKAALAELDRLHRDADRRLPCGPNDPSWSSADVHQAADMIRCVISALGGDCRDARDRSAAWLARWPEAPDFNRGTVGNALGYACNATFEFDLGIREIRQAKSAFERCRGHYGIAWAAAIEGMLLASQGRLSEADRVLQAGLAYSRRSWGVQSHAASLISLLLADVCYERGEREQAAVHVGDGVLAMEEIGSPELAFFGRSVQAKLLRLDGNVDDALSVLADGRQVGRLYLAPMLTAAFAMEAIVLLAREGRLDEAEELAARHDLRAGDGPQNKPMRDAVGLGTLSRAEMGWQVQARLHLARDETAPSLALFNRLIGAFRDSGRRRHLAGALALKAVVLERQGAARDAMRHLDEALQLGAAECYVQMLADDAVVLRPVLGRYLDVRARTTIAHDARAPLDYVNLIVTACGLDAIEPRPAVDDRTADAAMVQLTAKESELLRLVETGMSNRQIADMLFVSEKTVKWHLHNCFNKLGVRNRTGAVAAARRAALL